MTDANAAQMAEDHFSDARRRAFVNDVLAVLRGRGNSLVPYHEISTRTAPESEVYRGIETIRLDRIVGSVNRFEDFDRHFLPRNKRSRRRWMWIDRAWHSGAALPAIEVIRVSDIYFVKDGNHRVSVARQHGQEYIEAEVVEEHLRAPLSPGMSTRELLLQAEYAEFLRCTELDVRRPGHDIRHSALGDYDRLLDHVEAHRLWLERELEKRPVDTREAVIRWYDNVYSPLVQVMRDHDIGRLAPGRSEADMYLWSMERREDLYALYTRTFDPRGSAVAFVTGALHLIPRPGWLARLTGRVRIVVSRDR